MVIADELSARAWLDDQRREVCLWFGCRVALRTLPNVGFDKTATDNGLALATFRAAMTGLALAMRERSYGPALTIQVKHSFPIADVSHPRTAKSPINAFNFLSSIASGASLGDRVAVLYSDCVLDVENAWKSGLSMYEDGERYDPIVTRSEQNTQYYNERYAYGHHLGREIKKYGGSEGLTEEVFHSAATYDGSHPSCWGALWPSGPISVAKAGWESLKAQWDNDPDWQFWTEWYERILVGNPLPWELTQRIALEVTEEEWDAGPNVVAKRIAKIRENFEGGSLDQDALQSHMQQLARSSVLHADVAESTGLQIEAAILAFKRAAPANQLPDGFAAFEALAPTFLSISATLSVPAGTTPDTASLQAEVNRLHGVIARLRTELQDARHRLRDARPTVIEAQQVRTLGEKAATFLACVATTGIIGSGIATFFGIPPEQLRYEALKNALQELSLEMENVQPTSEVTEFPEITDV